MKLSHFTFIGLAAFALTSCVEKKSESTTQKQVSRELPAGITEPKKVETKPIWIDVRSSEEFQAGHLEGAINIPHDQIADKLPKIAPDKSAPINLYCRSGNRSNLALLAAENLGYTKVINKGAYKDLKPE